MTLPCAILVLAVVALLLVLNDVSALRCSRCVKPWALFRDGRCWTCYRAAKRGAR